MSKLRVLYIVHNHPALHPGGTEIFAHDLFTEIRRRSEVEALFVACTDKLHRERKPGTTFQGIGDTADEFLMWTGHFDPFFLSQRDLHGVVPEFTELLRTFQPDVVHFHHVLMIGLEALALVRRIVPGAKIVLTLHEYYAQCANDGQMVTTDGRLCHRASPDACHGCFPKIARDQFVLREQYVRTLFRVVDRFVAPSRFLRGRFIDWGIPPEKIHVVANGVPASKRDPAAEAPDGPPRVRNRFGFFGNINRFKGALVLLEATRRLRAATDRPFSVALHGSPAYQGTALKDSLAEALATTPDAIHRGPYARETIASLMHAVDWVVVPSVWWENAPLVIQEAFANGRPVIASGIGGMAEMVRDGVDGLHFPVGDPSALAETMACAIEDAALWPRLAGNIRPVRTAAEAAVEHYVLYRELTQSGGTVADLARRDTRSPARAVRDKAAAPVDSAVP